MNYTCPKLSLSHTSTNWSDIQPLGVIQFTIFGSGKLYLLDRGTFHESTFGSLCYNTMLVGLNVYCRSAEKTNPDRPLANQMCFLYSTTTIDYLSNSIDIQTLYIILSLHVLKIMAQMSLLFH